MWYIEFYLYIEDKQYNNTTSLSSSANIRAYSSVADVCTNKIIDTSSHVETSQRATRQSCPWRLHWLNDHSNRPSSELPYLPPIWCPPDEAILLDEKSTVKGILPTTSQRPEHQIDRPCLASSCVSPVLPVSIHHILHLFRPKKALTR